MFRLIGVGLDDEERLREALPPEFALACHPNPGKALEALRAAVCHLLLVDLDFKELGGASLLHALRAAAPAGKVAAIAMSSDRGPESVAAAFAIGLDDFLAKPYDVRELAVRCRVVIRRRFGHGDPSNEALTRSGITLEPLERRCRVYGKSVKLQPREFELLEAFLRREGRVLSRVYLLETVWGLTSEVDTRSVDVTVSRLRKKLGPRVAGRFESVSKLGYRFTARG